LNIIICRIKLKVMSRRLVASFKSRIVFPHCQATKVRVSKESAEAVSSESPIYKRYVAGITE
jgi:hypothetical protein